MQTRPRNRATALTLASAVSAAPQSRISARLLGPAGDGRSSVRARAQSLRLISFQDRGQKAGDPYISEFEGRSIRRIDTRT